MNLSHLLIIHPHPTLRSLVAITVSQSVRIFPLQSFVSIFCFLKIKTLSIISRGKLLYFHNFFFFVFEHFLNCIYFIINCFL